MPSLEALSDVRAQGWDRVSADAGRFVQDLSPLDLASSVGGLLLVPANLHLCFRLEALAHLAMAGVAQGHLNTTSKRLLRLCNHTLAELIGHLDDPWEQPATIGFTFHGGTHVVIPGGIDTIYELRLLARTLTCSDAIDSGLRDMGTRLIQAMAHLSDVVTTRAGLSRNQRVPAQGAEVTIPGDSQLGRLKAAVHFEVDELGALIEGAGARWSDVEPLIAPIGNVDFQRQPWESEQLTYQPLARSGSSIVVLAPHLLMQSAVRRIALHAMETGACEALADALHDGVVRSAFRAFEILGLHASSSVLKDPSRCQRSRLSHRIWQFDSDSFIHLAVVSDALAPGEGRGLLGAWDTAEVPTALIEARQIFEQTIARDVPQHCLLTLAVYGGAGRDYSLQMHAEPLGTPTALFFLASELEIIVHADTNEADSLLLWKYACSRDELARSTTINAWSFLDAYGFWKLRGRRFFATDDEIATEISIHPGAGAEEMRWVAVERYDWHSVKHPNGSLVEVGLTESRRPIYRPRQLSRAQLELVVVCQRGVIWIVSPTFNGDAASRERELYSHVVRALAYWVSEFAAALPRHFDEMTARKSPVVIRVDLGGIEGWQTLRTGDPEPAGPAFSVHSDAGSELTVTLEPAFLRRYKPSDNAAESELAAAVATALLALSTDSDEAKALVQSVLAEVAPAGPKRMLHQVDSNKRPERLPANRQRVRYLQTYDAARAQTASLPLLCKGLGATHGRWTGDKTQSALKATVAGHFDALRESVRAVDAKAALKQVMARSDSLLADGSERRDTLASQLACNAGDPRIVEKLREELPANAQASLATRFLVELLAAESPTGSRPMSDALFDEWLAIACEIISLGMACDVQHLALAEVQITLHPNGYQISRGTYGEASVEVQEASVAHVLRYASGARRDFTPSAWPFPTADEIDVATAAEFGCSLTEVVRLLGHVSHMAVDRNETVVEMPMQSLVVELANLLSWDEEKVRKAIGTLTLNARPSFIDPGPPYSQADVLPWKFNRALGYLRRPLVRVDRGSDATYLFAAGAPTAVAAHLAELCLEGRIKARSNELRHLMSRFSKVFGLVFNVQVADTMRKNRFCVREQVRKVGRARISADGKDLGDIDVLAADPYHKRLWILECKNFAAARVPHEVKNDLEELFIDRVDKLSVQSKHRKRVRWIEEHLHETLDWLSIPVRGRWKVCGGLVLSQSLISPLLGHATTPIWTLSELEQGNGPGVAGRPRAKSDRP